MVVRRELECAKDHVQWTMKLCALQSQEGRYSLFEHPKTATSWKMRVEKVSGVDGVETVRRDMYEFGIHSKDEDGAGLVKKPTPIDGILVRDCQEFRSMML